MVWGLFITKSSMSHQETNLLLFIFICLFRAWDQAPGLMCARQVFYQGATPVVLLLVIYLHSQWDEYRVCLRKSRCPKMLIANEQVHCSEEITPKYGAIVY